MTTFVLLPGAGSVATAFYRPLGERLRALGHEALPVDFPWDDPAADLSAFADRTLAAIGDRRPADVIVVAQSMGAFAGAMVADAVPVALLVLLCPMIPAPGDTGNSWWARAGQGAAARAFAAREGRDPDAPFDLIETFFHDVPAAITEELTAQEPPAAADGPFEQPWPLAGWPDVPTRVIAGARDRLFPLELVRRLTRERVGAGVGCDVVDGGHLAALSVPGEVAALLERYRSELTPAGAARA